MDDHTQTPRRLREIEANRRGWDGDGARPLAARRAEADALVARLTSGDRPDCERCHGRGYGNTSPGDDEMDCFHCKGTGKAPAAAPPCRTCGEPTMHAGGTCYGCAQAAWDQLVASTPPAPPNPFGELPDHDRGEPAPWLTAVIFAGALAVIAVGFGVAWWLLSGR